MNDLINAGFECLSGLVSILNIRKIYKDKSSSGVSAIACFFFTLWGFWNLYYYPTLNQTWSTLGAIVLTIANTIWFIQIVYYRRKKEKKLDYTQEDIESYRDNSFVEDDRGQVKWQCPDCGYELYYLEDEIEHCPTCGGNTWRKAND